ncbi:hypothetical protein C8J56DRAFT_861246 [Mycena floridula]|nr:hypothetical protein C8J56DRAFT_861246 [Mycena floridula]
MSRKKYQNRPNLDVLIGNRVTRVLPTTSDSGRLTTVEFATSAQSKQLIRASKEVILSAGAIRSPYVLISATLLFCILLTSRQSGSRSKPFGPSPATLVLASNDTLDDLTRNATVAAQALRQWNETIQVPWSHLLGSINSGGR